MIGYWKLWIMSAPDKQHSGIYTPLHSSQRNVGMKWQRHTSWYISGTVNLERIKNTLLCPWPCNTQYHSRSFSGCESGFYTSHRTATHLSFLQIHKCWIFTNDPSPSTSHQVKRLRTQCTALIYITHIRHFLQKIGFLTFFLIILWASVVALSKTCVEAWQYSSKITKPVTYVSAAE